MGRGPRAGSRTRSIGHRIGKNHAVRLAGKGWLKLEFDRLIFPDTDIPISAKVIAVRRFRVDEEGKILGQGHPKRDAVG
jgi:hypothetical protein